MLFEFFLSDVLVVCEDEHGPDRACELSSCYYIHRVERGQVVQREQLVCAAVEALVVGKRMRTRKGRALEKEFADQAK
jgi:hypothetical protein